MQLDPESTFSDLDFVQGVIVAPQFDALEAHQIESYNLPVRNKTNCTYELTHLMFNGLSSLAAGILHALPRNRGSRVLGNLAQLWLPQQILHSIIHLYCRAYKVNLAEAVIPDDGFSSFDQFFTRYLRSEARTIDRDPAAIVSPSDGLLTEIGMIEKATSFTVKGNEYRVNDLLEDDEKAGLYKKGIFAVIYLHPRDYHRVHAPVDGRIEAVRYVSGTLFPVNDLGINHIPNLFIRNERMVFFQRSPDFGLVTTVMIGAIGVGRISVSFDTDLVSNMGHKGCVRLYAQDGPELHRGEELGVFHLGSTVIFFLPQAHMFTIEKQPGDQVRMGEAIVRKRVMHE